MSPWNEPVVSWLVQVYLLSTVVLGAAGFAMLAVRQPSRRLAVARAALAALALLAPLAAGARWARLRSSNNDPPASLVAAECSLCYPIPDSDRQSSQRAETLVPAVFAAFAAGSGAIAFWLVLGAIASVRLVDSRTCVGSDRLRAILARVVGEGKRPPRLIVGARVSQPVAVGLIRPSIVLPEWFAVTEPEERIEAALAHEWAHIRNGDLWVLAVSRLLLPLLFAHPLYAWLRRRVRADQEVLADAAAAEGAGRIAYAETLLGWARGGGDRRVNVFAQSLGLWERSTALKGRIALLLDRDFRVEPICPRLWRLGVRGIAATLIAVLGVVVLNGSAGSTQASSRPAQGASQGGRHVHPVATTVPANQDTVTRWSGACCPSPLRCLDGKSATP